MKPIFASLLFVLLLTACAVRADNMGTPMPEPVFSASAKNESDQITFENRGGSAIIEVQSPTGIGSAEIELVSGAMPKRLFVLLHLAGLEEFRLSAGENTLAASFSSNGVLAGKIQTYTFSGRETSITKIHPYWLNIRVVSDQPTPTLPLEQGYFEVEIPGQLLEELGNSFEIRWVDFYR